jgi:hypothetical protein
VTQSGESLGVNEAAVVARLGYFEANTYDDATPADQQVGELRAVVLGLARNLDKAEVELAALRRRFRQHLNGGQYDHPEFGR